MRFYIDLIENAISTLDDDTVDAFVARVRTECDLETFDVRLYGDDLKLFSITVAPGAKEQGRGTRAMTALCRFADEHHMRVVLTPVKAGEIANGPTSRARLVAFYGRFGFIENKGADRDLSTSAGMYRSPKATITEAADLTFKVDHVDYGYGQHDMRLVARRGAEIVGTVDFVLYQGEVSIKMIRSEHERQGIGSAMMRELQRQYPDQEIAWGSMTDQGAGLHAKLDWDEVEVPDVKADLERLAVLRKRLDGFQAAVDAFHQGEPTEAARQRLMALVEPWNEVQSEVDRLEDELRFRRPVKRLIRPQAASSLGA